MGYCHAPLRKRGMTAEWYESAFPQHDMSELWHPAGISFTIAPESPDHARARLEWCGLRFAVIVAREQTFQSDVIGIAPLLSHCECASGRVNCPSAATTRAKKSGEDRSRVTLPACNYSVYPFSDSAEMPMIDFLRHFFLRRRCRRILTLASPATRQATSLRAH